MLTAGSTTFTYDSDGNRLTEAASSGTTTYDYDAKNRLLSVAAPSGTSTFTYDGDGNRITQTTPSGTYDYVNDTAAALPIVLNEKGPDGTIDYGYGAGLLESSSSAFDYFYNLDGLGSVSNLTDVKGTVEETYSYDAWGNALTATGSVGTKNKFRFTGQALDPASGLYFLRARYLDVSNARFTSKDQSAGLSRFPVTLNRYSYVSNNPLRFVDPSGLKNWNPNWSPNWNPNPPNQTNPYLWPVAFGILCGLQPEVCAGVAAACLEEPYLESCGKILQCLGPSGCEEPNPPSPTPSPSAPSAAEGGSDGAVFRPLPTFPPLPPPPPSEGAPPTK